LQSPQGARASTAISQMRPNIYKNVGQHCFTLMLVGRGSFLALSRTPLARAHGGCHGSQDITIPFISFTDEIYDRTSDVTLYILFLSYWRNVRWNTGISWSVATVSCSWKILSCGVEVGWCKRVRLLHLVCRRAQMCIRESVKLVCFYFQIHLKRIKRNKSNCRLH
jgi:hypothetical protein